MHIHILGICGTFMAGMAALAKSQGHKVTGCDQNVYPPMSTQLEGLGISITEGFSEEQITLNPDVFVIGNVISRGNPLMESILDQGLPYISGPQWLYENILFNKWVIAVAGTHGKTTTTAMLAWILEFCGLAPGFLIGGIPNNFDVSARLPLDNKINVPSFFVIEADEYDTAFFDKRSKFVHYHPRTLVVNNLEFDHADIFDDLAAIQKQFHYLIRTVPSEGLIIIPPDEVDIDETLSMGCWSKKQTVGLEAGDLQATEVSADGSEFKVQYQGKFQANVNWQMLGRHNVSNALAAIAAARHVGVNISQACEALAAFKGIKRRMELYGEVKGIRVYDDFAHHPTAIESTIKGLKANIGERKLIAILELRSNTMRMGIHKESLANCLQVADRVILFNQSDMNWSLSTVQQQLGEKATIEVSIDDIVGLIRDEAMRGDEILIMSNGGFCGIHEKILTVLAKR